MKRRAVPLVTGVDVKAMPKKVGDADGLVALGGYVKHVDALAVDDRDVCSVRYEQFDHFAVAVKGREVQRCEAILSSTRLIKPLLERPGALFFQPCLPLLCCRGRLGSGLAKIAVVV